MMYGNVSVVDISNIRFFIPLMSERKHEEEEELGHRACLVWS